MDQSMTGAAEQLINNPMAWYLGSSGGLVIIGLVVALVILVVRMYCLENQKSGMDSASAVAATSGVAGSNNLVTSSNSPIWWLGAQHSGSGGSIDTNATPQSLSVLYGGSSDGLKKYCESPWDHEASVEAAGLARMQALPPDATAAAEIATPGATSLSDSQLQQMMLSGNHP